jgi:hypothetical protein
MSSVTFSTTVGGDGSTVTDDDNATTGLGNGGALIRLVPMMQQVVNVAAYAVSISGGAGNDAIAAAASASAAATSATAAAASYDSFDDRYLGAKSSDPSIDNDGNALLTGAIYWNTASYVMKVWSGSAWVSYNPAISYLPTAGGTMTGNIVFNTGQPLGTPSSGTLSSCTGLPLASGVTGTLSVNNGGTGTTTLASNNVLLGNGTGALQAVAPGTSGNVLVSNGTTWASAAPAGALKLLSTVTASGASTVDIETTFNSTYDNYVIMASDVSISANQLYCLLKISGTYQTTNYTYVMNYTDASQAINTQISRTSTSDSSTTKMRLTNGTNNPMNFSMNVYKPTSSVQKQVSWTGTYGSGNAGEIRGVGLNTGTGALTGVQFNSNGGTVTGTFRLYGISN